MMEAAAPPTRRRPSDRTLAFLQKVRPATPCLIVDLDVVADQYRRLNACLPASRIFYAVKANPARDVITRLAGLDASFDLASEGEIERCLSVGIAPDRLSFGNTIKTQAAIATAFGKGIRLFAFDSEGELDKIARAAPGARVFCRILANPELADWPLTRKFGCDTIMAAALLRKARHLGLVPAGISFHVGSQQREPHAWDEPIRHAAHLFTKLAQHGIELEFLNLGGGFPGHYRGEVPAIEVYAEAIDASVGVHFGSSRPPTFVEPGRYLAADAGLLVSQVILVARKSHRARHRWVYVDAGRFNGLIETLDNRIIYELWCERASSPLEPAFLAGPTCDSTDIVLRPRDCELPSDLGSGDTIGFLSAGAYTASYASVEFNGFPPLKTYCI
jgi:ornithine decarboxylase